MLKPEEFEMLPRKILDIYNELEEFTIADISRRIAESGALTETALHQIRFINITGNEFEEINKAIMKANKLSESELDKLYDDAVIHSKSFSDKIHTKADLSALSPDRLKHVQNYADALKKQTSDELNNFTGSLGFATKKGGKVIPNTIQSFYQDTLNFSQMQISSGVIDYNTAVKTAIDKMANSGLRSVDYSSGWSNRIEVAVRRSVLTGVSQISGEMAQTDMHELDTGLVEVSAHQGARDTGTGYFNHKNWQGKVYSLSGASNKYPSLKAVTGYGQGGGLKGWNCRHDFFPFIDGVSNRMYTDEELRNIDPPDFEYGGMKFNAYEATQKQRQLETKMRAMKLKMIGYKAAGLDDDFAAVSINYRHDKKLYEVFSKKARLKTQYERTHVTGWNKSISSASFKIVDKYSKIRYNKNGTIKVTDDWKERGKVSIPRKYLPNAVIETKTIYKNGFEQINRSVFDNHALLSLQIHSSGHNRNELHRFGKNKDEHFHAHEYIFENGKLISKSKRNLTESERTIHADILKGDDE